MVQTGKQVTEEGKPKSRVRPVLLVLLWVWALLMFVVVDLFLDVDAFDSVRSDSDFYRSLRAAGHDMVGTPGAELVKDEGTVSANRRLVLMGAFEDDRQMTQVPPTTVERSVRRPKLVERAGQDPLRHGTYAQWTDPGGKPGQGKYEKGQRNGVWLWSWDNGKKREEREYKLGKLHGTVSSWYRNGTREVEEQYAEGVPHGTWRWWHANGQLGAEQHYEGGKLHGEAKHWYADGTRLAEANYHEGKPDGAFTAWHPNGFQARVREFDRGTRIGIWTTWNADGRILTEGEGALADG